MGADRVRPSQPRLRARLSEDTHASFAHEPLVEAPPNNAQAPLLEPLSRRIQKRSPQMRLGTPALYGQTMHAPTQNYVNGHRCITAATMGGKPRALPLGKSCEKHTGACCPLSSPSPARHRHPSIAKMTMAVPAFGAWWGCDPKPGLQYTTWLE